MHSSAPGRAGRGGSGIWLLSSVALINLYKALRGGWVDIAQDLAPRPEIADGK